MPAGNGGTGSRPQQAKGPEGLLNQSTLVGQEGMALQWQSAPVAQVVGE